MESLIASLLPMAVFTCAFILGADTNPLTGERHPTLIRRASSWLGGSLEKILGKDF